MVGARASTFYFGQMTVKLILTHDNADFDAVASLLAAYKLHPTAIPVLPRRVNRNVGHFLNLYGAGMPFVHSDDLKRGVRTERAVVVDTQSYATARGMHPDTLVQFIDHHPLDRKLTEYQQYTGESIGATTTLLVEQIHAQHITLEPVEATLLMLGIYEDTGSLVYGTTTPRDIRCAAWLLECGANLDMVREFLQHPLMPDQQELYDLLIANIQSVSINGHVIILACAQINHHVDEIATLSHKLRELYDPGAVFVLVQVNDDIQLVARGNNDVIDVSIVAKAFGGGGHSRAAAALIRGRRLDEVRPQILEMLPQIVKASIRVETLMSGGIVQTIKSTARVETAFNRMQRTGHEGFPVVEEDKIIGLLTRRAVDRAMSHGMGRQQVKHIMEAGQVTVRPDDSIELLQQRMMRSGWGQIPVVDEQNRLIGIVTRTDLIKHWGQRADAHRHVEILRRMQQVLSAELWKLIEIIAEKAQASHTGLFVVGGFVRDLLLEIPNHDVDLVVEGDAIDLVRTLQSAYGGEIRSHSQFGTAKWLLDESATQALGLKKNGWPTSIDFASARTEFYEEPTALPTVQRSSIKLDLHRRDFTINTLAIRLSPHPMGELLDFYGGEQDLQEGVIRVLHSLSFVDDPTRMLRAVRLEQRLGFQIESRTEELIQNALPLLDRVSGDRIRHELASILAEMQPLRPLTRLDKLGILNVIHPDLRVDEWVRAAFYALRYARENYPWPSLASFDNWMVTTFSLLTSRLPETELEQLGRRLQFSRPRLNHLHNALNAISLLPELSAARLPSEIVALLEPLDEVGWLAAWAASPSALARDQIIEFAKTWRFIKPTIDGRDLHTITQIKPGKLYGTLLGHLRTAWLDGEIHTPAEERELLLKLVETYRELDQ